MISLETPQRKWASFRQEKRTSWFFSSCSTCSRLTMGTSGTRFCGLTKGQSPCELLMGLSGFLSCRCRDLRSCVESRPQPEDTSPLLTWILGYFWSLPRGVSPRLKWGHARALSSRAMKRKRVSSVCGRDSRAFSRVETDLSANFLSCRYGVKTLWKFQSLGVISLETPQQK